LLLPAAVAIGQIVGLISGRLSRVFSGFVTVLRQAWNWLAKQLGPALSVWAGAAKQAWEPVVNLFEDLVETFWGLVKAAPGLVGANLFDALVWTLKAALALATGFLITLKNIIREIRIVATMIANQSLDFDEAARSVDLEDQRRRMLDKPKGKDE